MIAIAPLKLIKSIGIVSLLIGGTGYAFQTEDQWEAAAPGRKLEAGLGGRFVPWGHPGLHVGDETVNPVDRMEFVWVPPSMSSVGATSPGGDAKLTTAKPNKTVQLSGFWLAKYPVTWGQYTLFCKKSGIAPPKDPGFPKTSLHPVVGVTWDDAMAYARWAHVTLPTEFQWERASRGPKDLTYPWGDQWDPTKCANSVTGYRRGTTVVGGFRGGRSDFGCYDMAGNVSQWCLNWASSDYSNVASVDPQGPATGTDRAVRGGGWGGLNEDVYKCSFRFRMEPKFHLDICGFRCAVQF